MRVPAWDRMSADGTYQAAILDLRVEQGPGGPVRYMDVVVPHPVGPTNTRAAAMADGASAGEAERQKYERYGPGVVPLAVETFGRWGSAALRWWRKLAKQVVASDPLLVAKGQWAIPSLLQRWWGQVSVALQRANADPVFVSVGMMGAARNLGVEGAPEVYELLLPSRGAGM